MKTKHLCISIMALMLLFFIGSTIIAANEEKKPIGIKVKRKNVQRGPRGETEEEKQKRLRRWEKQDEAQRKLKETQQHKLEKFKQRQIERKERKAKKTQEAILSEKISALEQQMTHLNTTIEKLDNRISHIESKLDIQVLKKRKNFLDKAQ